MDRGIECAPVPFFFHVQKTRMSTAERTVIHDFSYNCLAAGKDWKCTEFSSDYPTPQQRLKYHDGQHGMRLQTICDDIVAVLGRSERNRPVYILDGSNMFYHKEDGNSSMQKTIDGIYQVLVFSPDRPVAKESSGDLFSNYGKGHVVVTIKKKTRSFIKSDWPRVLEYLHKGLDDRVGRLLIVVFSADNIEYDDSTKPAECSVRGGEKKHLLFLLSPKVLYGI